MVSMTIFDGFRINGSDDIRHSASATLLCMYVDVEGRGVSLSSYLSVGDPETPRNSGWPTVSGQPLRCLNVSESGYGILGASWIEGISIEIGD